MEKEIESRVDTMGDSTDSPTAASNEASRAVDEQVKALADAVAALTASLPADAPADPVLDPIVEDALWSLFEIGAARVVREMRRMNGVTRAHLCPPTDEDRAVLRTYMALAIAAKAEANHAK